MKPLITALTLSLTLAAGSVAAAPGWHDGALQLAQGEVTIKDLMGSDDPRIKKPLSEAVDDVRRETGGRILSAKTIRKEGLFMHRIKVLTPDQRVVIYEIDAGIAN
jgi:uncharacterized membrane protein YkoI